MKRVLVHLPAFYAALAAVAACVLVGCGTSSSRDARVAGTVKLCGGLGDRCFTEPVSVTILSTGGQAIANAHTGNGRFSFALVPGTYTVVARADEYILGTVRIDAVAHKTTRADITKSGVA